MPRIDILKIIPKVLLIYDINSFSSSINFIALRRPTDSGIIYHLLVILESCFVARRYFGEMKTVAALYFVLFFFFLATVETARKYENNWFSDEATQQHFL